MNGNSKEEMEIRMRKKFSVVALYRESLARRTSRSALTCSFVIPFLRSKGPKMTSENWSGRWF